MRTSIDSDPDHPGAALRTWLIDQALPIWSTTGVDQRAGGFFEAIDLQGRAVEAPRRTRVVARQVYVFATAARHGWLAGADALVDHGLAFMLHRLRRDDGSFASSVRPDGTLVDARFDLYEQAFALFALASARRDRPDRAALHDDASALLQALRRHWRHPSTGFEEAAPRTLPLRSNPHMHLLEAALEWAEVAEPCDRSLWNELADELAQLCLAHFIDPKSGALREQFDGDWQPMPGAPGRIVEPGHQFEWGWLLMRWAARNGHSAALASAHRLIAIGEAHGVDGARGVAVNTLDDTLQVTDANAKLWPQTERIKAWHASFVRAADAPTREAAGAHLRDSIAGLTRYLLPSPPGLWHEVMDAQGRFVLQDCRASSLYHIVCAIDTLVRDSG